MLLGEGLTLKKMEIWFWAILLVALVDGWIYHADVYYSCSCPWCL